jgi:NAD+ kinase
MVELFVQIDGRPLSRWGCDGVICATPTGSTAYAFSAGGPVLWPEVEAIVLLPLAAHALYSRPMVISPDSQIAIDIESLEALVSADGFRKVELQKDDRVIIRKTAKKMSILHIESAVFTDRLVAKFKLPIEGWRGE